MADQPLSRLREIFEAAFDLPPAERASYLDRQCAAEPELRTRLETLLASAEAGDPFLSEPTAMEGQRGEIPAVASGASEAPGSMIGPYKLLEQIGEGGFGTVFMAEQEHPVRRRVALKIIKLGMDTKQVIARFEAERQALAMMDHPGIARVLDAGATGAGRPYFVMELVRGEPITAYCDRENLTIPQRLELFGQVCAAVQHAHQKGVIHRDLKPSNILVTEIDGRPAPRIIDFGIAKAISGRLTEKTLFTEFRQLIGTPEYMSPEQAGLNSADIDTRSDIYSLGVLLYHLLTGAPPFDPQRLRSAAWEEMRRIIREEAPARPSTRLTSGGMRDSAARRHGEPARIASTIRGDLDWIAMKCLEKDRARRYETASGLAEDVGRYLRSEPVLAGPPSRVYRARKFVRRNRGAVLAAGLVAGALLAGTTGTTYGLVRAEQRRIEAEKAGRLAEERERQAQEVAGFQGAMLSGIDVEDMGRGIKDHFRQQVAASLGRQHVGEGAGRRPRTREEIAAEVAEFDKRADAAQTADIARRVMDEFVLSRASDALEEQFADQPIVQAQLHEDIGETYEKLGIVSAAENHFRKALELRKREVGETHELFAYSLHDLGGLWFDQGDYVAAEPMLRQALALYRSLHGECLHAADALSNLALVMSRRGDAVDAERLHRESLAIRRRLLGDQHPDVAVGMADLAMVVSARDYSAALSLYHEALAIARTGNDEQSPLIARILNDMGVMIWTRDAAEAERLLSEALAIKRTLSGDEHPDVAATLNDLAALLLDTGDSAAAEPLLYETLAIRRKVLGDGHPDVAHSLNYLGLLLMGRRDEDDAAAEEMLSEALAIVRNAYGDGHPAVAATLHNLGCLYVGRRDYAAAEPLLQEALAIRRSAAADEEYYGSMRGTLAVLSTLLREQARFAEAEPLLREQLELARQRLPQGHPGVANVLGTLGLVLMEQGRYVEAEPLARECLEIRERALEPDSPDYWFLANTRSMLGGALAGQGAALVEADAPAAMAKFTEAEPLLIEAGEWLKQNADRIPEKHRAMRLLEALERIVMLYEGWNVVAPGKAEQAAAWRAELEKLPGL